VHHNEAFQTGVIINPWNSFQESTVNHLFIVDTFHGVNKEDDVISYTWSGRALIPVKATTVYYDDELKKKQPLLAPENVFDFSQTSGTFEGCGDHARWNQHGGKHYFDHDYFAFNCPNTSKFDPINISYGDFIISREAVKRKAWKLLTYRGLQHLANFHTKFPQAKAAYDTAMYGWFTSRADIFRGMTNTEYMRFRLLLPCHGDEFEPPITKAP
jgi:hypothetical protein